MIKLRAHFDGEHIVLEDAPPVSLRPNTVVEVIIPEQRETAMRDWEAFSREFWTRALPSGFRAGSRNWRREDLHERGKPVY